MFNLEFLSTIRTAELDEIASALPPAPARILEIGAGRGEQAAMLTALGYAVSAVDIEASNYREAQVFDVIAYDGRVLPFGDSTFDVVFSSNVLEHIPDLDITLAETQRVLRQGGRAVHVVPTHAWRVWTTLSSVPAAPQRARAALHDQRFAMPVRVGRAVLMLATAVVQRRHGERGNVLSEMWWFRPERWRREFRRRGFIIGADRPVGIFYTGNMVMGDRWSITRRRALAGRLGSACHLFVISMPGQECPAP